MAIKYLIMPEGYLSVLEIVSGGPILLCAKFFLSLSSSIA